MIDNEVCINLQREAPNVEKDIDEHMSRLCDRSENKDKQACRCILADKEWQSRGATGGLAICVDARCGDSTTFLPYSQRDRSCKNVICEVKDNNIQQLIKESSNPNNINIINQCGFTEGTNQNNDASIAETRIGLGSERDVAVDAALKKAGIDPEPGLSPWIFVGAGVGIVVIGFLIWFLLRNPSDMSEDEEEDEQDEEGDEDGVGQNTDAGTAEMEE